MMTYSDGDMQSATYCMPINTDKMGQGLCLKLCLSFMLSFHQSHCTPVKLKYFSVDNACLLEICILHNIFYNTYSYLIPRLRSNASTVPYGKAGSYEALTVTNGVKCFRQQRIQLQSCKDNSRT